METLIDLLPEHDFIIADFATKIELLKWHQSHPLLKLKIYTPEEILSGYLGTVDEKAILKIIPQFNLTYEYAKIILANITFETNHYQTVKTSLLSNVRTYLIDQGLLYRDPLTSLAFGGKKAIIYPYLTHHKVLMRILKTLKTEVSIIPSSNANAPKVYEYKNGIEETYDTLNKIASLIESGVPARRIKVMVSNHQYEQFLRHSAPSFNLLFQPEENPLIAYPSVYDIVSRLSLGSLSLTSFFEELKTSTKAELNAFYRALMPYALTGEVTSTIKVLITDVAKKVTFTERDNDGIEILTALPQFSNKDTHYFFINFVQGTAPSVEKVSPYLSLNERNLLAMIEPEDLGQMAEERMLQSLLNIPNMILSWAPNFGDAVFYRSALLSKFPEPSTKTVMPSIFYSQNYLNYLLGDRLDQKKNYNVIDPLLSVLYHSNQKRNEYDSFDFRFKGIDYKHPRLSLSYSTINLYQNLPFDYFAEKILNLKDYSDTFSSAYGTFVHKVFETSTDDATFEVCFNHYLDQYEFTVKDKFFIDNQRPIVKAAFDQFMAYRRHANPSTILNEQEVKLTFEEGFDFSGRLDCVFLFERNDVKTAVVIDFKTGKAESRSDYYQYGLDLQLPLYGMLLKKDPRFAAYVPGALVICSLKTGSYLLADEALLKRKLESTLKFSGLVINDPKILTIIDRDYLSSSYYAKLKYGATSGKLDGVVETEQFDHYIDLAETIVKKTHAAILRNDFPVSFKYINGKISGEYSSFREISYIPEKFIGGDDDDEN